LPPHHWQGSCRRPPTILLPSPSISPTAAACPPTPVRGGEGLGDCAAQIVVIWLMVAGTCSAGDSMFSPKPKRIFKPAPLASDKENLTLKTQGASLGLYENFSLRVLRGRSDVHSISYPWLLADAEDKKEPIAAKPAAKPKGCVLERCQALMRWLIRWWVCLQGPQAQGRGAREGCEEAGWYRQGLRGESSSLIGRSCC
jgi:hypothetical protein